MGIFLPSPEVSQVTKGKSSATEFLFVFEGVLPFPFLSLLLLLLLRLLLLLLLVAPEVKGGLEGVEKRGGGFLLWPIRYQLYSSKMLRHYVTVVTLGFHRVSISFLPVVAGFEP
jgi:hypothetical protein